MKITAVISGNYYLFGSMNSQNKALDFDIPARLLDYR